MNIVIAGIVLLVAGLTCLAFGCLSTSMVEFSTPQDTVLPAVLEVEMRDELGHFKKVSCPVCGAVEAESKTHFTCPQGHHYQAK